MKLVKNILTALVALPLVAGLASCSEKEADYSEAALIANDEVYFASTSTTVELSADENTAYVDIYRVKTTDEINVPLTVTSSNPKTVPAKSVQFAKDSKVARIPVTYDPAEVEAGKFDTLTIAVGSTDYTTPYGSSSTTVLIGKAQTWTLLGNGQLMDIFWDDENYYEVQIEQCDQEPNTYRIVDPYKDIMGSGKSDPYFTFSIYNKDEVVADGFTAPFDGFVMYEPCNSGYYYADYGQYIYAYHPWYFEKYNTEANLACNRVEIYKEDGTPGYVICSAYYYMNGVGGWPYADQDAIKIVMPGYELADYSATIDYAGKFIDTEDKVSAVANVALGADVSSAKIAIYPGKASNEGLDFTQSNGTEITANGEYKLAMPEDAETGNYTLYVITYNAEGDEQDYNYSTFKYVAGAVEEETWTPMYVGTWTYTLYAFANYDSATDTYSPYDDEGLVLSRSDQNPDNWKIDHLWNDVSFYFTWDQTNNVISFETQFTGANYGYGDIYATDMVAYGYDPSYYDQAENTFKFDVSYADSQYGWGYGFENFKLTGKAEAAKRAIRKATAVKKRMMEKSNANAVPVKTTDKVMSGSGKVSSKINIVKFENTTL